MERPVSARPQRETQRAALEHPARATVAGVAQRASLSCRLGTACGSVPARARTRTGRDTDHRTIGLGLRCGALDLHVCGGRHAVGTDGLLQAVAS